MLSQLLNRMFEPRVETLAVDELKRVNCELEIDEELSLVTRLQNELSSIPISDSGL